MSRDGFTEQGGGSRGASQRRVRIRIWPGQAEAVFEKSAFSKIFGRRVPMRSNLAESQVSFRESGRMSVISSDDVRSLGGNISIAENRPNRPILEAAWPPVFFRLLKHEFPVRPAASRWLACRLDRRVRVEVLNHCLGCAGTPRAPDRGSSRSGVDGSSSPAGNAPPLLG